MILTQGHTARKWQSQDSGLTQIGLGIITCFLFLPDLLKYEHLPEPSPDIFASLDKYTGLIPWLPSTEGPTAGSGFPHHRFC